jgi:serine protease SohB
MAFVAEYGMFLLKALTVLLALVFLIRVVVRSTTREISPGEGTLRVKKLNRQYQRLGDRVRGQILSGAERKALIKARKAERKAEERGGEGAVVPGGKGQGEGAGKGVGAAKRPGRLYVLRFAGDIRASAVESLRQEITAVLAVAEAGAGDEVLLRLDSGGGMVNAYGLAASQLDRLRQRGVKLTVAVDRVAASGGYMMACVADRILAAPFAVVGSIGVVAMIPNVHRLLKRHDVDVELITAGEFKRTLTVVGENTDKGRAKLTEQIEEAHRLFKDFVGRYRPELDMAQVATGEHWYGTRGVELGLVDALQTSDDYLLAAVAERPVYEVCFEPRRTMGTRLASFVDGAARRVVDATWQAGRDARYGI